MKNNTDLEKLEVLAAALAADHRTRHITEKTLELINDAERLQQIAAARSRMSAEQAQGWMFEQLEVLNFNLDALRKASPLRAMTTDSLGATNHETVDVIVKKGQEQIRRFQLKSGGRASSTAFMLADGKYAAAELVGPADQYETVKSLYERRAATGALKADDYASARQRLRQGVAADNVASEGTAHADALRATDPAEAARIAARFKRDGVLSELHQSGLEAGKMGAGIAGGVSGVIGLVRLARGEADTGEVVVQASIDAAKGFVTSYVTGATGKGLVHVARTGMEQVAGKAAAHHFAAGLTKSNAHVALAAGIVQAGKSLVRYLNGDIDDAQLLSDVSHTAITGATAFYYGAFGQALIPIPIVGAFVGSTVGYFIGNMLHQSALIGLGETAAVRVARERRERVAALCMTAIPLMRAHRLELERLIDAHFQERRALLATAFDDLEQSLTAWDGDGFLGGLERVNRAFGAALPFRTLDEFDAFMDDDDQAFVL